MTQQLFKGAGVALITPFNTDKSVDYNTLEKLVEYQVSNGIDYIVALGTTAETPTLTESEKNKIIDTIRDKVAGRVPIMLGLGGNNLQTVLDKISETDFVGIDGILSVTPYYNKPQQAGLIEYYKQIADVCPVPVILYNVPSRTGVNLSVNSTIELANHKNIVAIKEASGDLSQMLDISYNKPNNFALISGDDGMTLPIMSIGGVGVISVIANAFPRTMSDLVKFVSENKIEEARKLQLNLLRVINLVFKEGSPSGIKALLALMGLSGIEVRLPLVGVSESLVNDLSAELQKIDNILTSQIK